MVECVSCKKRNPLGCNLLLKYSNCFKRFLDDSISLTLLDRYEINMTHTVSNILMTYKRDVAIRFSVTKNIEKIIRQDFSKVLTKLTVLQNSSLWISEYVPI